MKKRTGFAQFPLAILEHIRHERIFYLIILIAVFISSFAAGTYGFAMWLGFLFSSYAVVSNDSIQSLGTFIESNRHRRWWILWLFTGTIFAITVIASWLAFHGDVTYHRLVDSQGNTPYPQPSTFQFVQLCAPIVLLIITRWRMPVSTTFLILSVFSSNSEGISSMVIKSVSGYLLAFFLSFVIWYGGYRIIKKYFKKRKVHFWWSVVQWTVSGCLWAVWLMQDGANVAVFLPRFIAPIQLVFFVAIVFFGMGLLFYLRGDKIQAVVSEKSRIGDVRAATLIDFTYALLLLYKLFASNIPMSTTWVFLGTIGGREIAINLARKKKGKKHKLRALGIIFKDLAYATTGLVISVGLATIANPRIREDIIGWVHDFFLR